MATGVQLEATAALPAQHPTVSAPPASPAELFKGCISKLSASSLAELCHRLRVQLIQQRLPLICSACRPSLIRAFNMELNLTQLIRGLCKSCKALFMAAPAVAAASKPVFPKKLIKSLEATKASIGAKVKRVVLKISGKSTTITSDSPSASPRKSSSMGGYREGYNILEPNPNGVPSAIVGAKVVRVARALSEPLAIPSKRRYAKQLQMMTSSISSAPMTPPPTPAPKGRKRRATADMSSEVLVSFDADAVVKRPSLAKSVVFTPSYREIGYPSLKPSSLATSVAEALHDPTLIVRHARYEEVEKTMRLCRPEVLRSLYSSSPNLTNSRQVHATNAAG